MALLIAAVLQAGTPIGISFEDATTLPANDLAVRVLGEAGRRYVGVHRLSPVHRSPPTSLRFFTKPEAASERLCIMYSTTVTFGLRAPGQEALDEAPEGWRDVRKLAYGTPYAEDLFRLNGLGAAADFRQSQAACGLLEASNEPGWFAADDVGSAELAIRFARMLLPHERNGVAAEPAVTPEAEPVLARMRLDKLGMVKARGCDLLQSDPGWCLVMYFQDPDDQARILTLIIAWQPRRGEREIQSVRAYDRFIFVR